MEYIMKMVVHRPKGIPLPKGLKILEHPLYRVYKYRDAMLDVAEAKT
jgi:hypothetical protein